MVVVVVVVVAVVVVVVVVVTRRWFKGIHLVNDLWINHMFPPQGGSPLRD